MWVYVGVLGIYNYSILIQFYISKYNVASCYHEVNNQINLVASLIVSILG